MTPYPVLSQAGKMPEVILNFAEIAVDASTDKDTAKLCLHKMVRDMVSHFKESNTLKANIPSVGTLHIRNGVAAIKFSDDIAQDFKVRLLPSSPLNIH